MTCLYHIKLKQKMRMKFEDVCFNSFIWYCCYTK